MNDYAFRFTSPEGLRKRRPKIEITDALMKRAKEIGGTRLVTLIRTWTLSLREHGIEFPISTEFALRCRGIGKVTFEQMERLGLIKD